jgi:hypothetical protein
MTADQIIETLSILKEKILGWPTNVTEGDPDLAFQSLENQLRHILSQIQQLTEGERQSIQPAIETFKQAVTERHKETEEKMAVLRGDLTTAEQRQRAFRAYGERV